jgi:hypothetical protein
MERSGGSRVAHLERCRNQGSERDRFEIFAHFAPCAWLGQTVALNRGGRTVALCRNKCALAFLNVCESED